MGAQQVIQSDRKAKFKVIKNSFGIKIVESDSNIWRGKMVA